MPHLLEHTGLLACFIVVIAMARPTDWAIPIKPFDVWSDDVRDVDYNMMVRAPHPYSHEKMRRADPMYDLVILTDWNWPYPRQGRRICHFYPRMAPHRMPQLRDVIGLSRANLLWVAQQVCYETRLIIPPLAPALRK